MASSTGLSTVALKVSGPVADPTIRPAASEPKSIATARTSLIFTGSLRQRSRGFRWRPLVRRQRAVLFTESHRAWKPDQASQSAQHLFRKHCRGSPTEPRHARIAHPVPPLDFDEKAFNGSEVRSTYPSWPGFSWLVPA